MSEPLWSGIKGLAAEWWFMSLACVMWWRCGCEVVTVRGSLMKSREDRLNKSCCIISCLVCSHVLTCTLLQSPGMNYLALWHLLTIGALLALVCNCLLECALVQQVPSKYFLIVCFSYKNRCQWNRGDQEQNCRIVLVGRDLWKIIYPSPLCNEQAHLQLDQLGQSFVQPGLECCQVQGIYHHPPCKKFLSYILCKFTLLQFKTITPCPITKGPDNKFCPSFS